jgi:putrescine aminotransferase
VYLYDSEGRQILDAMSGLWCVNVGYGRQELAEAAARQMRELPYYNSFFKSAHPPAIELASQLAELTPPQFNRVFFTNSGSEANDTIIRMTRRYWDLLDQPKRQVIISRLNAYHGSTMAGEPGRHGGNMPGRSADSDIVHIEQPTGSERRRSRRIWNAHAGWRKKIEELGLNGRPSSASRSGNRQRRHHSAGNLLAGDPGSAASTAPADRGRSDLRLWSPAAGFANILASSPTS